MSHPELSNAPESRWPSVVGTVGIVLGVLMFLDKLDDLLLPLLWSEDSWSRFLGPEMAERVVQSLPSAIVTVPSSLVGMALALLLVVGSVYMRHRSRAGVQLCRAWGFIAIAWALLETGGSLLWLTMHADEIPGLETAGWQGYAAFGVAIALVVLLAYPVFVLTWLSRPRVHDEWVGWPA